MLSILRTMSNSSSLEGNELSANVTDSRDVGQNEGLYGTGAAGAMLHRSLDEECDNKLIDRIPILIVLIPSLLKILEIRGITILDRSGQISSIHETYQNLNSVFLSSLSIDIFAVLVISWIVKVVHESPRASNTSITHSLVKLKVRIARLEVHASPDEPESSLLSHTITGYKDRQKTLQNQYYISVVYCFASPFVSLLILNVFNNIHQEPKLGADGVIFTDLNILIFIMFETVLNLIRVKETLSELEVDPTIDVKNNPIDDEERLNTQKIHICDMNVTQIGTDVKRLEERLKSHDALLKTEEVDTAKTKRSVKELERKYHTDMEKMKSQLRDQNDSINNLQNQLSTKISRPPKQVSHILKSSNGGETEKINNGPHCNNGLNPIMELPEESTPIASPSLTASEPQSPPHLKSKQDIKSSKLNTIHRFTARDRVSARPPSKRAKISRSSHNLEKDLFDITIPSMKSFLPSLKINTSSNISLSSEENEESKEAMDGHEKTELKKKYSNTSHKMDKTTGSNTAKTRPKTNEFLINMNDLELDIENNRYYLINQPKANITHLQAINQESSDNNSPPGSLKLLELSPFTNNNTQNSYSLVESPTHKEPTSRKLYRSKINMDNQTHSQDLEAISKLMGLRTILIMLIKIPIITNLILWDILVIRPIKFVLAFMGEVVAIVGFGDDD